MDAHDSRNGAVNDDFLEVVTQGLALHMRRASGKRALCNFSGVLGISSDFFFSKCFVYILYFRGNDESSCSASIRTITSSSQ
jgi:hypothetical protein